jgi:hypothetical protein
MVRVLVELALRESRGPLFLDVFDLGGGERAGPGVE